MAGFSWLKMAAGTVDYAESLYVSCMEDDVTS